MNDQEYENDSDLKDLIHRGLVDGFIKVGAYDNTQIATIGEYWFYFGDPLLTKEREDYSCEELTNQIYNAMQDLKEGLSADEYWYYYYTLKERTQEVQTLTLY